MAAHVDAIPRHTGGIQGAEHNRIRVADKSKYSSVGGPAGIDVQQSTPGRFPNGFGDGVYDALVSAFGEIGNAFHDLTHGKILSGVSPLRVN